MANADNKLYVPTLIQINIKFLSQASRVRTLERHSCIFKQNSKSMAIKFS